MLHSYKQVKEIENSASNLCHKESEGLPLHYTKALKDSLHS